MRTLGVDPVADTRTTFRALVDAMSRPGTIQTVPAAPADHAVLSTLVDHEVSLHTADELVADAFAGEGRLAEASFAEADVVHVHGHTDGRVREAIRGSLTEPSDGATVVYRVDSLSKEPTDDETTLAVSGPGVPDERTIGVGGFPLAEVEALADATAGYPRGIDVVLAVDARIAALPRTASVVAEVR